VTWQIVIVVAIEVFAVAYLGWKFWPREGGHHKPAQKPDVATKDLLKKRDRRV
jgi:hypothetical protein